MKYTLITLLIVLIACMATADCIKSHRDSELTTQEVSQNSYLEDEYWPFEKTVSESDPYLLEVAQKLEKAD